MLTSFFPGIEDKSAKLPIALTLKLGESLNKAVDLAPNDLKI
jgi:hypothetical protein